MARATLKEVKARIAWKCHTCQHDIVPGERYWLLSAFWQSARYCSEHKPSPEVVKAFGPKSRADRASEVADGLRSCASEMRDLAVDIRDVLGTAGDKEPDADILVGFRATYDALPEPDFGEVESLVEEMTNWRDGMSGTGLENTAKFEEVGSAADALESLDTYIDIPSWEEDNLGALADELEQVADNLESTADDLEGIDFPGMY